MGNGKTLKYFLLRSNKLALLRSNKLALLRSNKLALFGIILVLVLGITGYLIFSTISTNVKSVTKGPVHYHGDFEIWSCGQKLDLMNPKGWDNKVGIPLLHEHNDRRIHVEGPVMDYADITLGNFFKVVGGEMNNNFLTLPTNNGPVTLESGMGCNGEPVEPQVFVFRTDGNTFYQEKIADYANYVLSPYSSIPPGDCIIIELDKIKQKTDKLCNFYKVAKEKGELVEK